MTRTASLVGKSSRIVHEEPHDWLGGLLGVLCACLALACIDLNKARYDWKVEAERSQAELQRRDALGAMPNPAIVLDARTAEEFGLKIAEIAGGLDGVRAKAKLTK